MVIYRRPLSVQKKVANSGGDDDDNANDDNSIEMQPSERRKRIRSP